MQTDMNSIINGWHNKNGQKHLHCGPSSQKENEKKV